VSKETRDLVLQHVLRERGEDGHLGYGRGVLKKD
jgi:hypothetical protein